MKVVFATGIFPPDIGGPASSVATLAEAWSKLGHHVTVVTYSEVATDGISRPYEVKRVPRALPFWRRYWSYAFAVWKTSSETGPIFAQDGFASGLPAWIVSALRGRRLIIRVAGDFAWERAQVKYGYTESIEKFQNDRQVPIAVFFTRWLQRFIYRRADLVIVPSHYLAGVAEAWGVNPDRIRVIYNGVHTPKANLAVTKRTHRIVAAGRLVPWKNFDVLIKAMPKILGRYPGATLMIAGDGPEEARLRSLAAAPMMAGKVEFAGRMKRDALHHAIQESTVFVLPSSYEGFSHQLVEAFACGAAVVASRAGGNPELVQNGKNGLLVEPGDVSGLADAIINFLDNPVLANTCATEAIKEVPRFSVEKQINETSDAVLGNDGISNKFRVLMISRDGTAADPTSRTAARMCAYGDKVDKLSVVCLAKGKSVSIDISDRVHVELVDIRGAWKHPWKLFLAVRAAAFASHARLVVAQDPFEAGLLALFAARSIAAPLLVEEHGGVFLSEHWKDESLKNRLSYPLGLFVMKRAAGLRAVSAKIEAGLKLMFPTKPVFRASVYSEPRACRSSAPPESFGTVGRFVPQKNLFGLLRAFSLVADQLPTAHLTMAGSGPLERELRMQARELGISGRVTWLPYDENVDAIYARIGTYVLPSWYEGWARVVPEAMSCGIPVVMSDVGCAQEVVRNGVEGYVVPIGEEGLLAKAMLEISRKSKHDLMSAATRRRAETLPKPEQLVETVVAAWKKAAGL